VWNGGSQCALMADGVPLWGEVGGSVTGVVVDRRVRVPVAGGDVMMVGYLAVAVTRLG